MHSLFSLLSLAGLASAIVDGIDPRDAQEELEHMLVDNSGTNFDGFIAAVTPCTNYFQDADATEGEQTSAQWVRIVFHDFVTANLTEGTGGLDGSIAFEADRAENAGFFVNDTLQFMFPTFNAYTGMADNIALGLVAAVATCNGSSTAIPLRSGRRDAVEAGPSGVPEPTTDLETTLNQFAAAGFSQEDTIASTACGHSLGRIHYSNFPDIVSESAVTDNNTNGGVSFDTTPAVFDSNIVNEYLDGTGNQGGLLVTATNETKRSDLRLYLSDNNATAKTLTENEVFRDTCYSLFERMVNTVPTGVNLSDPIVPMTWKAVDLAQDISSNGTVTISGMFRWLYTEGTPAETVEYKVMSDNATKTVASGTTAGNGSSLYGSTYYWDFNTTLDSPGSTTALAVGGSLSNNVSYPVNDKIFILPYQSTASSNSAGGTINTTEGREGNATVRAAVLSSLVSADDVTLVAYVPINTSGTYGMVIDVQNTTMSQVGTAGQYTLFETTVDGYYDRTSSTIFKAVVGDLESRTIKIGLFNVL